MCNGLMTSIMLLYTQKFCLIIKHCLANRTATQHHVHSFRSFRTNQLSAALTTKHRNDTQF